MNGVGVLKAQLQVVNQMLQRQIDAVQPAEWAAQPGPGLNPPGYTLWHAVAAPDWVMHTAVRGLPELRTQGRWADHPGVNPPLPPFGCTGAQALALARTLTPDDLRAYAADVHAALLAWLDTLTDGDLDGVPDLARNTTTYPAERLTADYLAEVDDMTGWNVARFLASPCIGHLRGHFGELEVHLTLLRAP